MTEPTKEPSQEQLDAWHQEATGGTKTLDLPCFAKLAFAAGRKAGMHEMENRVLTIGHLENLSAGTHNRLLSAGLVHVDKIMLMSVNDILKIPNMGSKHVGELAAALGDMGIKWPGKAPIRAAAEAYHV